MAPTKPMIRRYNKASLYRRNVTDNMRGGMQKLNGFLERSMSEGLVTDGTVAQDTSQFKSLWQIRESFAEAGSKYAAFLMVMRN